MCFPLTLTALQEELNLAARRVSLAPTNRNNIANRSLSGRTGSMHWARLTTFEGIPSMCLIAVSRIVKHLDLSCVVSNKKSTSQICHCITESKVNLTFKILKCDP